MNLLDVDLKEISLHYGFPPKTTLIDQEICVELPHGHAAMRFHSGHLDDLQWVYNCLEGLRERRISGTSRLIPTLNGEVAVPCGNCHVYFTEYVQGTGCDGGNAFEVRAIGHLLGSIHSASEDILYFNSSPETRRAPPWLQAAQERAAYWRMASHRYRQSSRGEVMRLLLRDAQTSLSRYQQTLEQGNSAPVLSFTRLSFAKFVYLPASHKVYLNSSYECYADSPLVTIAEMLLDLRYNGNAALHFLSAYQAVRPLSLWERQSLLAYLTYPHEWAKALDDLTTGRQTLKIRSVMLQMEEKREWLEWLGEKLTATGKHERGGFMDVDMEEKLPVSTEVKEEEKKEEEQPTAPVAGETAEQVEEEKESSPVESEVPRQEALKKLADIVWKPFPPSIGHKPVPVTTEEEEPE
jgi:Ser/Thr protein kinase RdoA (MazF antagonist)